MVLIAAAVLPRLAAIAAGVRAAEHPTAVVALEEHGETAGAAAAIRPIHRIVDAADSALEKGVAVGQRLIDAQAFFPALRAVSVSARALKEQLDVVAEALLCLSPLVEPVLPRPGIALPFFAVVVDLTGLPRPRARLLSDIARVLAEQGQPCAVAVSSSRTVSLACARLLASRPRAFRGRLLDVDAADPAWLRRTLGIEALDLDDGVVAALRATGVMSVQDLVPLVDQGLVPRLGRAAPSVLRVLRVLGARPETSPPGPLSSVVGARPETSPPGPLSSFVERGSANHKENNDGDGDSDGLVRPLVPTEVVGASRDLEMGVTTLEPLLFVLRPLVEGIVRRLQHRRQRLAELTVALGARKKSPLVVSVPLASPTVDVAVIVRVLSTRLERVFADEARRGHDDDDDDSERLLLHVDGIERLMLVARRTTSADPRQLGLTVEDERGTPEALLHLISELQARHGEGCVGVPVVTRQRLPEAMSTLVWPPTRATPLLDEAHSPRRRRQRPVVIDARTRHGRFAAGWPWPLRLLSPPTALPFSSADIEHDAPFALLEGDDERGPYRRRYRRVTLKDGRQALTLVDDEAGVTWLSGWFE